MTTEYLLKPYILGNTPEISISKQQYLEIKRCNKRNYEAFEMELAFDFVVKNYIEIEKFIAEHLVLDMTGQTHTENAMREQHWGFTRVLSNWLASISFWHDITRNRLRHICGREELKKFEEFDQELKNNEFAYAFIFHLRNYSQHGGFPVTGFSMNSQWDNDFTELSFSANYTLSYDHIRPYFEVGGKGSNARKDFGKRILTYNNGEPLDLKDIIRKSLESLGLFMDETRTIIHAYTDANESFILDMIQNFSSAYPETSILGLSVFPVDENKTVKNKSDVLPVRDEFIIRSKELRVKNTGKRLKNMEKRIISNK